MMHYPWLELNTRKIALEIEGCVLHSQAIVWCLEQGIQTLCIGNPDGVQRNPRKKRSRRVSQKLSQWPFGELFPFFLVAIAFLQTVLSFITITGVYLILGGNITVLLFALFFLQNSQSYAKMNP